MQLRTLAFGWPQSYRLRTLGESVVGGPPPPRVVLCCVDHRATDRALWFESVVGGRVVLCCVGLDWFGDAFEHKWMVWELKPNAACNGLPLALHH